MGELDAEFCGARDATKRDDARERRLALVGIKAHAAMGDAARAFDMGGLDNQEAGARGRQHAEMRQVPIGGAAIDRTVLAHRRHDNAIDQCNAGELQRREQGTWHGRKTGDWRGANDTNRDTARKRLTAPPLPSPACGEGEEP
jgi:hypothetical protein